MDKTAGIEYGLLGEKLSHSFSKLIHEKLCGYSYELIEVEKDELDSFLTRREFKAINVTIPYKESVIPYLEWIDPAAERIGSVNTVLNRNGKLYGYNTDYKGFLYTLKSAGVSLEGKRVLILGSGGTCKTALAVAEDSGASEILVATRNGAKKCCHTVFESMGKYVTYEEAIARGDAEVIINTTPVGMYPSNEECPIELSDFSKLCGVIDVIYNPLKTTLLQRADELCIPNGGGLPMLVAQAKYAAELFLGGTSPDKSRVIIPEEQIEEVLRFLRARQQNLVLIGMPGCGKSRMARHLSTILNRQVIDTDREIIARTGKTIPEIFTAEGEEGFRKHENEVVAFFAKQHGLIIATGGGAIINPENVKALRQNGVVVFIDRPPEQLPVGGDRPLSTGAETIKRLFDERLPLYLAACDLHVVNNDEFEKTADTILDYFEGDTTDDYNIKEKCTQV